MRANPDSKSASMIVVTLSFLKSSVLKMFSVHLKTKTQILLFEERFQKVPFSRRISVDGRPNRTDKAVFS